MYNKIRRSIKSDGAKKTLKHICHHAETKIVTKLAKHNIAAPKLNTAVVEITSDCNLSCGFCAAAKHRSQHPETPKRYIQPGFFRKVIGQLAEMKVYNVGLNFGGESLLHPNFSDLLKTACDARVKGIGKISWIDNGMLFTPKVSKLTVDLGVDGIMFSVDKWGNKNNSWRTGSNIDVVTENIKGLVAARGNKKKPRILINKIDCEDEFTTWLFIVGWLKIVDEIRVSPLNMPHFKIADKKNYFGVNMEKVDVCSSPFSTVGILADGRVSACTCDDNALNCMGNLNVKSLREIWGSKKYVDFRRNTLNHQHQTPSPCAVCDVYKYRFKPHIETKEGTKIVYGEAKTYTKTDGFFWT